MTAPKLALRYCVAATIVAIAPAAQADAVTDWNAMANDIVVAARIGPAPGQRVLALAQVATLDRKSVV